MEGDVSPATEYLIVVEALALHPQQQKIALLQSQLQRKMESVAPGALDQFPIDRCVREFELIERDYGYSHIPAAVANFSAGMAEQFGMEAIQIYNKLLLLSLVRQADSKLQKLALPASVRELLLDSITRVVQGIGAREGSFYAYDNDLFVKDLGVCRLKLIPCGAEVIDRFAGVPRSILFSGGVKQMTLGGSFIFRRTRGFRPLYESHWDRRLIREFNPGGYDRCYARVAEMLELNPDVKGMFGASWWFDPAIDAIAPELSFLRKVPIENGALVLRVGVDSEAIHDAITFSSRRKKSYEDGEYLPERYMLIWARKDMLDWMDRYRNKKDA